MAPDTYETIVSAPDPDFAVVGIRVWDLDFNYCAQLAGYTLLRADSMTVTMTVFVSLPSAAGGKARCQERENLSALSTAKEIQVHPSSEHLASLAECVLSSAAAADDYLFRKKMDFFFPVNPLVAAC